MNINSLIIGRNSEKFERINQRKVFFESTFMQKVVEIIDDVRSYGDKALREYIAEFDGYELKGSLVFERQELKAFYDSISKDLREALLKSKENVEYFHRCQLERSFFTEKDDFIVLGQKVTPLQRVGVYTPGGKASYPSSVIMNVVPAKVAGVNEINLCTPTTSGKINDAVMAAAYLSGVDRVFRVGGAQAIAAMAYGTESIPKVDKIVGPGNIFVALAKKMVFGLVDIDMIAGPSELVIIASEEANSSFVAADMLAQAEHDELAMVLVLTDSISLAKKIENEVKRQLNVLPKKDIAEISLNDFGGIIVVNDLMEAFNIVNAIAPEHLELMIKNPDEYIPCIKNCGAIFVGESSPTVVGDYIAGPNHTLPTAGSARFFSPLGVYDFIKRTSIIKYTRQALLKDGPYIIKLAETEGLTGHANSVYLRMNENI
jgi:histidinol dehydrogenase